MAFIELLKKCVKKSGKPFFYINHKGFCPICNRNTAFVSDDIWLRDNFLCANCGSIPRQRALMMMVEKYYPDWRNLKIHECGPSLHSITKKFVSECKGYIPTQYFPGKELGATVNGYRNEDLEKQTFGDEVFDLVITQDVFEHIYDPGLAFSEIARTLKKGGSHIFAVPLENKFNKTEVWAIKGENGEPVFLKTEDWHGPAIAGSYDAPVTMHWGFDIVDFIREHSGLDTKIEYLYDMRCGIWAEYIEILVSRKRK